MAFRKQFVKVDVPGAFDLHMKFKLPVKMWRVCPGEIELSITGGGSTLSDLPAHDGQLPAGVRRVKNWEVWAVEC